MTGLLGTEYLMIHIAILLVCKGVRWTDNHLDRIAVAYTPYIHTVKI